MRSLDLKSALYAFFAICVSVGIATAQETIAIKAGRLIDGSGAPAIENAVVIVRGDRIEDVGSAASVPIPQDARVIDLGTDTVLPGLINGHDHPSVRAVVGGPELGSSLVQQLIQMGEPQAIQIARGVRNLRVDLLSGITTEYVVGDVLYNDVYLKRMVDSGVIPGPRMYLSGPWIIPTNGYDPMPPINGPWAMREAVRKYVEAGAHHIKIIVRQGMATGPSSGRGRPYGAGATNFTKEELEAVIDEAHRVGVKITAHAGDLVSIRLALEAGVDSVQHASVLTPELGDLFVKHKASIIDTYVSVLQSYLTPKDLYFMDSVANSSEEWIAHARKLLDRVIAENPRSGILDRPMQENMKYRYSQLGMARDKGIPIAVGTDNIQGLLIFDIEHLVNSGFTPLQAISAATGTSAKALGIENEVGTLEKGKYADIISVEGRPDQNIRDLDKVNFIMVGGKNYSGLSFR